MEEGGAVAVVTTGTAANPVVMEAVMKKGGKYTCSYDEERYAMSEGLKWMLVNQKYDDTVVCLYSQALLTCIETWEYVTGNPGYMGYAGYAP